MKTVIVGCGRVGSVLADAFDRAGHDVIVIDMSTSAFDRLPGSFGGSALRGDGTDEDTLRRAGAVSADLFMAMTEGDNRNVMAAQLAVEALDARQVIAKINDPLRAAAYADLGINTLCRTNLMATAVSEFLGLGLEFGPGMSEATGHHPGGEHHVDDSLPAGSSDPASPSSSGDFGPDRPPSTPGGAPTSTPTGASASTQAPALPVAGREG